MGFFIAYVVLCFIGTRNKLSGFITQGPGILNICMYKKEQINLSLRL